MIDPRNLTAGIIWLSQGAKGTFYDPISSRLYLLDAGNTIKRWAAGAAQSATWKSPQIRVKDPVNAGAGMVVADEPVSCQFTLWANKLQAAGAYQWEQVFARTVQTNLPFSLPSGYVAHDFQVQITTSAPVQAVTMAEDFDELP